METSQRYRKRMRAYGPHGFFLDFNDDSSLEIELPQAGGIKLKAIGKPTSLAAQFEQDVVETNILGVTEGVTFTFHDGSILDAELKVEHRDY